MREMKDSGIEWIGTIPSDWNITKLKYLFSNGKGLPITKENLTENGLPVISYGQIHSKLNNGTDINPSLLRYVDASYQKKYPQCEVFLNDFIFADTSEDYEGCGNCVYKRSKAVLYAGYHCIVLHSKYQQDNRFLAYLFKTDIWRSQIRSIVSGVKVFSVTQKILLNCYAILPSTMEQKRIADFLDKKCSEIDSLTEDIKTQIETLEQYKKSLITETVTKGLDPNVEMKDSRVEWIGKIPADWNIDKFKFHLVRNENRNSGDKQVLSLYREYGVIPKDSRDDNHNVTSEDTSKYKYVKAGYFVVNKMKAWQGSVAVSNYEGIVSPAYYVYEFIDEAFIKTYFHYLLRSCYKDEFMRLSGGIRVGQWDLPADALENIAVLIPPIIEQKRIADFLDKKCSEIDAIISQKQEQLSILDSYKKSLIYEYVTGKKEVLAV